MAVVVDDEGLSNGKTIGGITIAFAGLGLLVAILALASAPFVGGISETAGEVSQVESTTVAAGTLAVAAATIPFVGAPILAVIMSVWAGTQQRDAGHAWWTAPVGVLAGVIAMIILITVGFAIGGFIGDSPDPQDVQRVFGVQNEAFFADAGFFVSSFGLVYLLSHLITASVTAALVAWLMPDVVEPTPERVERRTVA